jgi:hypothetical protein
MQQPNDWRRSADAQSERAMRGCFDDGDTVRLWQ